MSPAACEPLFSTSLDGPRVANRVNPARAILLTCRADPFRNTSALSDRGKHLGDGNHKTGFDRHFWSAVVAETLLRTPFLGERECPVDYLTAVTGGDKCMVHNLETTWLMSRSRRAPQRLPPMGARRRSNRLNQPPKPRKRRLQSPPRPHTQHL